MTTIQLVATDLDGTLLRSDGTISARTCDALARVQDAHIVVVLVTARPPHSVRLLAREMGVTGLAICCNGALVYHVQRAEIVEHTPLAAQVAQSLIGTLRTVAPGICFAMEMEERFGWEPAYVAIEPLRTQHVPYEDDALILAQRSVTKLLARHATLSVETLLDRVCAVAGDKAHVTTSGTRTIEIAAAGVHKGQALAALCNQLGMSPAAVIAFGDMPNDVEMLHWAGYGVAVANAHPALKDLADAVTLSNDDDGVAVVLERLLTTGSPH